MARDSTSNVRCSTFGVCFYQCFRHISPPNEPADQPLPRTLRASRRTHGTSHSDATTKERRSRRGLRWGRHRQHFRRANDERIGEVHHVAGGDILRAYVCVIGALCAPQRSQQRIPSRTDEEPASAANVTCSCRRTIITSIFARNQAGTGFAGCFAGRKRSANKFTKIVVA
jgi:hypothetical protein